MPPITRLEVIQIVNAAIDRLNNLPLGLGGLRRIGTTATSAAAGDKGTTLTTKGDVQGFSTENARIPVGADNFPLVGDSTAALGVAYKALPATGGGTAQTSWTLGDTLYSSATNVLSKLAGNTTATRKFLRQTGTGSASAAPAWDTVTATDVGLGNVENTALSTWAGSANLTTTGNLAPLKRANRSTSATGDITATDSVVGGDAGGAGITLTLPDISTARAAQIDVVQIAGAGAVTVAAFVGNTINGAASVAYTAGARDSRSFFAPDSGTDWWVL